MLVKQQLKRAQATVSGLALNRLADSHKSGWARACYKAGGLIQVPLISEQGRPRLRIGRASKSTRGVGGYKIVSCGR